MAIEIPNEGLNVNQATDVISGILRQPVEAPDPEPKEETTDVEPRAVEPDPGSGEGNNDPSGEGAAPASKTGIEDTDLPAGREDSGSGENGAVKTEGTEQEEIELDQNVLAQFLGVEGDDLVVGEEGLSIKAKVDGSIKEVPLKELKDSYQLVEAAEKRFKATAKDREEFKLEREQTTKQLAEQQQYMAQAMQVLEEQYANDWKQTDWKRLRDEDPDNYMAIRQDYDDRKRQVEDFKNHLIQYNQQFIAQQQAELQKTFESGIKKLDEAFTGPQYKAAPKWDESERTRLAKWMQQSGMSPQELSNTTSWAVFKWARDSMLREEELKSVSKTVSKVAKLPKIKVSKPGSKTGKSTAKRTSLDDAKAKQRKAAKIGNNPLSRKSNLKETTALIEKILRG